jgi:hypothetical protein
MHSSLAALGIQRYFNYMPYPFAWRRLECVERNNAR